MSGGSWDYLHSKVDDAGDRLLASRDPLRQAFGAHVKLVAKALHDVEWVDSYDFGEAGADEAMRACLSPGAELEAAVQALREATAAADAVLARVKPAVRGPLVVP